MTKLGFGFLRLPLLDKKDEHSVDHAVLNSLTDKFIEKGGRYFDTAFTYLGGASEEAIRFSLSERYPREKYILADKLPSWLIRNNEDCEKIFEKQLSRCGVDFFDVYMLHWLNETNYITAETFGEFEFIEKLKSEGKVLKTGFSFHDSPELLEKILIKHPEIDCVQLQINYLDWESPAFRARECYEVAEKFGKEIIVMEPIKGGTLSNLPPEAKEVFQHEGLVVDFTGRLVVVDGKHVEMSPREYDLFFFLVKNRGIALSREKLINEVWGYDFLGDDRTIDTHIKQLRKILGPYSRCISTLRGVGYRFDE